MIIEIALGIVLAVLILRFFREILGLALLGLFLAVVLAIIGVVIYFAIAKPGLTAVIAVLAALVGGTAYWDSKQHYEKPPPLDAGVTSRLKQDDTESERAAALKDAKSNRRLDSVRARWSAMTRRNRKIAGGAAVMVAVCLLASLVWFIYSSSRQELYVAGSIAARIIVFIAAPLGLIWLVLDFVRSVRK